MLRPLYPPEPIPFVERGADVVVLPGVGTPGTSEWCDDAGRWLEKLSKCCSKPVQVLEYDYRISYSSKDSILQQLIGEGSRLLSCLDEMAAEKNSQTHPVFYICHSLGGVILKKALCVLRERFYELRHVLDAIGAILFLGTPHLSSRVKSGRQANLVELILQSTQEKWRGRHGLPQVGSIDLLATLSLDFEHAGVQVPIYSCYEYRASKVYKNIFAKLLKPQHVIIIAQEQCQIGSTQEFFIGIDSTHKDLCKIPSNGSLYMEIQDIVLGIINKADTSPVDAVAATLPSGLGRLSLRSSSTHGPDSYVAGFQGERDVETSNPNSQSRSPDNSGAAAAGSTSESSYNIIHFAQNPTNFAPAKRNPQLPCFSMRTYERNHRFFGREDVLQRIDNALLPDRERTDTTMPSIMDKDQEVNPPPGGSFLCSFAICGFGGTGKTQIAIEYAHSRKDEFDAIFWVSADDKVILTEDFARIAITLGLVDPNDTKDLPAQCDLVNGWLSNPVRTYDAAEPPTNDASWLLIFDNVDDIDVLNEFWPTTGIGSVLVTSRDSVAKQQTYTANKGVDLTPFSTFESAGLIKSLTPESCWAGQETYVSRVADRLGGLPLLITQVSSTMVQLRLSCKDFLRLCDERGIEKVTHSGSDTSKSASVFSIFSKIGLAGLSQMSLGLLQMISMLDPDRIPEKIFWKSLTQSNIVDFPQTVKDYYEARAQLLQSSLIDHNPKKEEVWLHRIIQDVTRDNLSRSRHLDILEGTVQAISFVWPFGELVDRFNTARYEDCANLWSSVVRVKAAQEENLRNGYCKTPDVSAKLFNDAGWYWFERGYPQEAKTFWRLTEMVYEQADPDAVTEQKTFMLRRANLNHATASMETNDREDCLKRYKRWLDESLEESPDPGNSNFWYEVACIYNETGVACAMNEMYDDAIGYFMTSIEKFQKLDDYDDTMLNWPEPNLGFMYWIQGRYDDAERVLSEILEVHKEHYGEEDTVSFKTGKILYALGNVRTSQGLLQEGFEYHAKCLRQYQATLGNSHHRVGDVLHRLADHNIRWRELENAETMIDTAIDIFSSRPYYKNELARSTYKRAQVLQAMGNTEKATEQFNCAFKLRQALVPGDGRMIDELTECDYDNLVIFWSR